MLNLQAGELRLRFLWVMISQYNCVCEVEQDDRRWLVVSVLCMLRPSPNRAAGTVLPFMHPSITRLLPGDAGATRRRLAARLRDLSLSLKASYLGFPTLAQFFVEEPQFPGANASDSGSQLLGRHTLFFGLSAA